METLTIRLLQERKSRNPRRKIDGYSGKVFTFLWNDEHDAYCYTTAKQEEVDDLFNSQGRRFGALFAPVITIAKPVEPQPLSGDLTLELLRRDLALPDVGVGVDSERIALAVLAGYDRGRVDGAKDAEEKLKLSLRTIAPPTTVPVASITTAATIVVATATLPTTTVAAETVSGATETVTAPMPETVSANAPIPAEDSAPRKQANRRKKGEAAPAP